jgi:hypothetical protein
MCVHRPLRVRSLAQESVLEAAGCRGAGKGGAARGTGCVAPRLQPQVLSGVAHGAHWRRRRRSTVAAARAGLSDWAAVGARVEAGGTCFTSSMRSLLIYPMTDSILRSLEISQVPAALRPGDPSSGGGCVQCGRTLKLKSCSRCHTVWYCCRGCQKAHWRHHKQHCKAVK